MKGLTAQLVVVRRPLLGMHATEQPRYAWEWYGRIAASLGIPISDWRHECYSRGPVRAEDEINVLGTLCEKLQPEDNNEEALIADLSAYRCRAPAWDGLGDQWYELLSPFRWVVLIFDPYASAIHSQQLKKLRRARKAETGQLVVMDSAGSRYELDEKNGTVCHTNPDLRQHVGKVSEGVFRTIILQRSNRFLGHFVLPSRVHVRTHYDLYPVVTYPKAYEHIRATAEELNQLRPSDLIVGFGLGSAGLTRLCDELGTHLRLPSLFYTESARGELEQQVSRGSRKALLLSDVLLTGSTASAMVDRIQRLGGEVSGILAVIGLSNSVDQVAKIPVTFCARLARPFYDESACELCTASGIPPQQTHSPEDFQSAVRREVSNYDFWELVKESEALEIRHSVSPNEVNHYLFRVNTPRVLSRYGDFIAGVLAARVTAAVGDDPVDAIACPAERGALYLAYALASKLGVQEADILPVSRADIERYPPTGGDEAAAARTYPRLCQHPRVLAVDDGVNSAHTLLHMISLLRAGGAEMVGYAVFLDAAEDDKRYLVRRSIGDRFFAFHQWRLGPFTRGRCPACMGMAAAAV